VGTAGERAEPCGRGGREERAAAEVEGHARRSPPTDECLRVVNAVLWGPARR
jgi:hypothetical protein